VNDAGTRTVAARAKVNLFLRVLGRRADGYHDLESLVLPIDLADRIEVALGSDPGAVAVGVQGRPELTEGVPTDGTNLAVRAAAALAARLGHPTSVRIRLEKRIPAAGGLGGGSADAAAVLRALNDLWAPGLGPAELAEVAAEVGSDVPALLAEGPVLVGGRGERVVPVRAGRPLRLVLVTFRRGVSTPEAFGWWDSDGGRTGPDPAAAIEAFEAGADPASLGPLLFNDLQGPVVRRRPDVGAVLERLAEAGVPALVSGSGPTVFGLLGDGTERLDGDREDVLRGVGGGDVLYVA
jgi:4-diphosphocytidyl-2-C-methyl-D-erythritol kinase